MLTVNDTPTHAPDLAHELAFQLQATLRDIRIGERTPGVAGIVTGRHETHTRVALNDDLERLMSLCRALRGRRRAPEAFGVARLVHGHPDGIDDEPGLLLQVVAVDRAGGASLGLRPLEVAGDPELPAIALDGEPWQFVEPVDDMPERLALEQLLRR